MWWSLTSQVLLATASTVGGASTTLVPRTTVRTAARRGRNPAALISIGAYFAASALGGMSTISQLDDGTGSIGVYALGDTTSPSRVVIYNSAYFVSGSRSYANITLTDMIGSSAAVKRLTAPYSTSRVDQGQNPTFAGQMFANATCAIEGTQVTEEVHLEGGAATFSVGASEALLVEFKAHKY